MRRLLPVLLAGLLLWPVSALAADPPDKAAVAAYAARLMETAYPADGAGAAVLVARGDEVLVRDARGRASLELDVPLSAAQVFRLGSVTKQIAAAGVLKLAQDGRLSLDDPLTRFVPDYPDGERISVRMLLDHTSGIRSYTAIPGVMDGPIQRDLDTVQLIDTFKDEPPDFAPGAGYRYNNSGYVLVGAVIEAASGQAWHDYLRQAFFEPLGMARTGYGLESAAVIPGHVRGYTGDADAPAVARYLSMTQPHAAGALVSSVDDLLRWNRALHHGRVLDAAHYRAMTTPAGKAAEEGHYGFGIVVGTLRGQRLLEHGGGIFGFATHLMYLPGSGLTVAVLQNTDNPRPGLAPGEVARRLAAFALGAPYPDPVAADVDPALLQSAEGVYRIDAETTRVLRVVDGRLTSQRSGGRRFDLVPAAPDDYVFADSLARLWIERDAAGAVTGMRFSADGDGDGEPVPRTDEPLPDERARVDLPAEALARVTGTYAHDALTLRVFLDDGRLHAQLSGQPPLALHAESAARFHPAEVEATLVFAPDDGAAQQVTLLQGGQELVFARQPD
ncbi:beta-lactamase family protein [Luteimonas sp. BDR2-5]|uniref:serine hydrolase domain-containing protein n=1 Tax=Proluteimonas luteida TaxID=2878685 RepID=UPI001E5761E0|nr:serine hydrolase domain-containing protein [Luteimonas sp. BDR2-5]MCD9027782.1 beta-lactamase family protein [Luteimonas sp. BDR2-5]